MAFAAFGEPWRRGAFAALGPKVARKHLPRPCHPQARCKAGGRREGDVGRRPGGRQASRSASTTANSSCTRSDLESGNPWPVIVRREVRAAEPADSFVQEPSGHRSQASTRATRLRVTEMMMCLRCDDDQRMLCNMGSDMGDMRRNKASSDSSD